MKSTLVVAKFLGTFLVIALGVASAAKAEKQISIETGTDLPGKDYRSFAANTLEECIRACVKENKCKALTYAKKNSLPPDFNNPDPVCRLKSAVPKKALNKRVTSGIAY